MTLRRLVPPLLILTGLLGGATSPTPPTAVAAPVPKVKKADPFPHAVGTRWEYVRNGNEKTVWAEEVAEVDEKDGAVTFKVDITTHTGGKMWEKYRLKGGELTVVATNQGEFDPPMLIGKEGMKEGDEWEAKWTLRGQGFESTTEETLTVGKAEEITTPAGKYTATPVHRKGKNGGPNTVFWFAEGVGMVRQTAEGQKQPAQHLKAFTPGKK